MSNSITRPEFDRIVPSSQVDATVGGTVVIAETTTSLDFTGLLSPTKIINCENIKDGDTVFVNSVNGITTITLDGGGFTFTGDLTSLDAGKGGTLTRNGTVVHGAKAAAGGADQTDPTGVAVEYTALSEVNVSNRATLSFDNDYNSTKWASAARPTVGSPQWIKANFDRSAPFDTKVFVRELSIVGCIAGQTDMAPKDFALQRSDDDSAWTTVLTVTNQTVWTVGERRNFAV